MARGFEVEKFKTMPILIEQILTQNGYQQNRHHFKRLTQNTKHFVDVIGDSFHLFGFSAEDNDEVYDTGIVSISSPAELTTLITLFLRSHN